MAGAVIGVSHLVQATRAGAEYGYQLLVVVLLANLFKYPFFEYGHRYAAASGENLLQGYLRLGKGYLYVFFALNIVTAQISIAGVTFVTAGLAENLFGGSLTPTGWSAILMMICVMILLIGKYRWLDGTIKGIMAILVVTTVAAFTMAAVNGPVTPAGFQAPSPWTQASLAFLIALMGWMPGPIEVSVWQSLWIEASTRATGRRVGFDEARVDFNLGYALAVVLAILFLLLGTLVMHGSGIQFANSGVAFAAQVVSLYTKNLGDWTWAIISIAAFTTMFSTTLTLIDAYPRSLAVSSTLAFSRLSSLEKGLHWGWLTASCLVSLLIINAFLNRLKDLVDLATIIAFLAGPVFAYLNYRLITSAHTPHAFHPPLWLRLLSWAGLLFFVAFGILFLGHKIVSNL